MVICVPTFGMCHKLNLEENNSPEAYIIRGPDVSKTMYVRKMRKINYNAKSKAKSKELEKQRVKS